MYIYTTSDRVQYPQCQLHIPRHIHPLWGYSWNAPAVKLWFHHIPLDFLSHRDWITTVINKVIPIYSIPQSFFEWPEKIRESTVTQWERKKEKWTVFFFHRFHRGELLYTHSGSRWTLWSIYWWTHLFLFNVPVFHLLSISLQNKNKSFEKWLCVIEIKHWSNLPYKNRKRVQNKKQKKKQKLKLWWNCWSSNAQRYIYV